MSRWKDYAKEDLIRKIEELEIALAKERVSVEALKARIAILHTDYSHGGYGGR